MKKILIQFSATPKRLEQLITACRNIGVEYEFFSYYSENQTLDDMPEDLIENKHFTFSSIQPMFYALKKEPKHYKREEDFHKYNECFINSFYGNDFYRFEQEFISNGVKDGSLPYIPMLNEQNTIKPLTDIPLSHVFENEVFIKPNNAFKSFIGGVTLPGETFEEFLFRKKLGTSFDIEVMMAPFFKIHSEYRFFVYNGIPLEWSSYIHQYKYDITVAVPETVVNEAFRLAKLFQPGKAFTLDLCLLENGDIKIVEYNHFTASGNYSCSMEKSIATICSDC